jgi:hypothetical protein
VVLVSEQPGRFTAGTLVKAIRVKMGKTGVVLTRWARVRRYGPSRPQVSDALKKGVSVSIVTLGGRELEGMVCDGEQTGLLLEVSEPEDDRAGYVFLPDRALSR